MHSLRQQLFGALIGLSRASESKEILESSGSALIQGLVLAYDPIWTDPHTEVSANLQISVEQMINVLHTEKALMAPALPASIHAEERLIMIWQKPWKHQKNCVIPKSCYSLF